MAHPLKQGQDIKTERFLAALTRDSEFFGLVGVGYPNSLYKIYVRPTSSTKKWWMFEIGAGPSIVDPIKYQSKLPVSRRTTAVWAPLPNLVTFDLHPERISLAKLYARARELHDGESTVA